MPVVSSSFSFEAVQLASHADVRCSTSGDNPLLHCRPGGVQRIVNTVLSPSSQPPWRPRRALQHLRQFGESLLKLLAVIVGGGGFNWALI